MVHVAHGSEFVADVLTLLLRRHLLAGRRRLQGRVDLKLLWTAGVASTGSGDCAQIRIRLLNSFEAAAA